MTAPNYHEPVYHMCRKDEWRAAQASGSYFGSSQDVADGFIHLSTGEQIVGSAAKHRAGQKDLLLLAINPDALGDALKWEPSRGGALFPHLYGPLPLTSVKHVHDLPLGPQGLHLFPALG
jgi:uncharacterized protein (DUF952 family)